MPTILFRTLAVLGLGLLLAADAVPAVNLLKNGELTDLDGQGSPAGWALYAEGQDVAVDQQDRPEGSATSLKVQIESQAQGQGSVSQKLKDLPPNVKLRFSAQVKCTADGVAFLQVKGKAGKSEVFRENSDYAISGRWQELTLDIDTGEADEVSVQCRFRQGDEGVGQTVWFADARLVKID